jgi:hypothetical protein
LTGILSRSGSVDVLAVSGVLAHTLKDGFPDLMLRTKFLASGFLTAETVEYLDRRFEDHRGFGIAMLTLAAFLGPSLWIWDHVTNP